MPKSPADRAFWSIVALGAGVAGGGYAVFCCGAYALVRHVGTGGWLSLDRWAMAPVVVLAGLLMLGAGLGTYALVDQVRATRRLSAALTARRLGPPLRLVEAAQSVGLEGRVVLVDTPGPFSLTYGMIRPRVAISAGLLEVLDPDELSAVLVHEAHHVRSADPQKVVVARTLCRALFVLPAVAALVQRYLTARELEADRRAVRAVGVANLAGALLKATAGRSPLSGGAAAGLVGDSCLELRLQQLETGSEPSLEPLGCSDLARSAVACVLIGAGMVAATFALAPLVGQFCHCS